MKRAAIFLVTVALIGCTSSSPDEPGYGRGGHGDRGGSGDRGGYGGGQTRDGGTMAAGGIGLIPTSDWWHQPQMSGAMNLTSDQLAALDAIERDQADPIERLRRDSTDASRNLRTVLESDRPTADDILESGRRLHAVRGELLDREVKMLSDERHVLTQQQWTTLEQALQQERSQGRRNGTPGGGYGGGRGRRPGRGFPGGF
jgi:Spy/CpxP family protein refolding chaperone